VAKNKPSSSTRDWASDKYQHVIVQRNLLALITLGALGVALVAVLSVYSLTPLKSVEPYLLTIDEKTGLTQKVEPVSRNQYASNEAVDRYFLAKYVHAREAYLPSILKYNMNVVRTMSTRETYYKYLPTVNTDVATSLTATLKEIGNRQVRIRSISYIQNPTIPGNAKVTPEKIAQVRFMVVDTFSGSQLPPKNLIATINFEYADLDLTEQDQLTNPLGFTVTSYQINEEQV